MILPAALALAGSLLLAAADAPTHAPPQAVTIRGYAGEAMEPHLTRDGRYLLFNNLNLPPTDTNLYYAERLDDLTFQFRGEIAGANTASLEGTPTTDRLGNLYFVSLRSYARTASTIYRGRFLDGRVSGVELVPGVSRGVPGMVNFDVDVSPDGEALYFVDSRFSFGRPKWAHLVVAARRGEGFQRDPDSQRLLRNVNVHGLVYAPCISADDLRLFFTRMDRDVQRGVPALYLATRPDKGSPFGPARRLAIDGFVEGPALSPDGAWLYFHRRDGAHYAIYRAPAD
ncbi:hypothetical protein [Phenylobacterium sp.]|uniref:TolB family protein n=1 Tax=Phenylobacterium sp. TaxID=1871053 RepID=UPI00286B56BD|nr:hypothetical protein [Phenylobacterium sp.]